MTSGDGTRRAFSVLASLAITLGAAGCYDFASHKVPADRPMYSDEQPDVSRLNASPRPVQTDPGVAQVTAERSASGTVIEQQTFDTPEAASQALVDAVNNPEKGSMTRLFGPGLKELVSGDPVQDKNNYQLFSERAKEKTRLQKRDENTVALYIGNEDWPFAIPIVKRSDGKWFFDTEAGKSEILARRIGGNELAAIGFCHSYVLAQREYAGRDHDGNEVLNYAQRLKSSEGKKDGLFYPSTDLNDQSPFGPLVADAADEGYGPISGSRKNPTPFHGYVFHILKAQGNAAPGGAYNYVINGNMIAGFALVAAPAEYGQSGIMTFIISHQGKIYQKDCGAKTAEDFRTMTEYNPDSSWTLVKE